jgi:phosphopentomutase
MPWYGAGLANRTAKRRFFLLVLDGCGAGEMPDAGDYGPGDLGSNTLGNTARAVGGLQMPHLQALGWGNITPMLGVTPLTTAPVLWGRLAEASKGKDTVTGHWEMMGVRTDIPFPTYPNGFPPDIIARFAGYLGVSGVLANCPASGTEVLKTFGEEHLRTGLPIVYTSADSVFQVAAHEDTTIFGLDRLYDACAWARQMLTAPHHVGRVIARPFVGTSASTFRRTEHRRDYPLLPPHATDIDRIADAGLRVHLIGKVCELFPPRNGVTQELTTNNPAHCAALGRAVRGEGPGGDADFIFANLEDFDMLYGHRNDPIGFARLLTEFDAWVGAELLPTLRPQDIVGITADHGNDPTTPSTDHSREYAPLLLFGPSIANGGNVEDRTTFADWGATVRAYLGINLKGDGVPFYGL